jgi:hypothetical protein
VYTLCCKRPEERLKWIECDCGKTIIFQFQAKPMDIY